MGRIRTAFTIAALIALTTVSVAAMVEVLRIGLPERLFRTSDELLEWLTENDFAKADPVVQRRLIRRMEEEFNRNVDWAKLVNSLDDQQGERFVENFSELMRVWFLGKVNAYFELPDENERRQFLRDEMTNIFNWKIPYEEVIEEIQNPEEHGADGTGQVRNQQKLGTLFRWQDEFAKWQERSTPEEQQKIAAFVSEVMLYLVSLRQGQGEWPDAGRVPDDE